MGNKNKSPGLGPPLSTFSERDDQMDSMPPGTLRSIHTLYTINPPIFKHFRYKKFISPMLFHREPAKPAKLC
ncbi:MAG: hypothetical protein ABS79_06425 [Planctomycetes bacterium SCN 63-9]|nr:MAG: hypothetical protein ABS79_06425 [Planctomycetes bacterium SCN 63-9]